MLAQARPLWSALPEGALQASVLAELAAKGNLPLEELASLWNVRQWPARRGGGPRRTTARRRTTTAGEDPAGPPGRGRIPPRGRFRGRWGAKDREAAERARLARRPRPRRRTPEDGRMCRCCSATRTTGSSSRWTSTSSCTPCRGPHGTMIAWLERDLSEHGLAAGGPCSVMPCEPIRPSPRARCGIADGDADPDATFRGLPARGRHADGSLAGDAEQALDRPGPRRIRRPSAAGARSTTTGAKSSRGSRPYRSEE
jgi:DNA primase